MTSAYEELLAVNIIIYANFDNSRKNYRQYGLIFTPAFIKEYLLQA